LIARKGGPKLSFFLGGWAVVRQFSGFQSSSRRDKPCGDGALPASRPGFQSSSRRDKPCGDGALPASRSGFQSSSRRDKPCGDGALPAARSGFQSSSRRDKPCGDGALPTSRSGCQSLSRGGKPCGMKCESQKNSAERDRRVRRFCGRGSARSPRRLLPRARGMAAPNRLTHTLILRQGSYAGQSRSGPKKVKANIPCMSTVNLFTRDPIKISREAAAKSECRCSLDECNRLHQDYQSQEMARRSIEQIQFWEKYRDLPGKTSENNSLATARTC